MDDLKEEFGQNIQLLEQTELYSEHFIALQRENYPAPPTRTLTQASLTRKP